MRRWIGEGRGAAGDVTSRRLNLDRLCARVSEEFRCEGPSDLFREFHHSHTVEQWRSELCGLSEGLGSIR